jgi:transposase-like protein
VREAALAVVHAGLAEGRSLADLAREMKMSAETLRRWLARERGLFRAVQVTDPVRSVGPGAGLVLQTATGHRVEGLDLPGVLTLLEALEARA